MLIKMKGQSTILAAGTLAAALVFAMYSEASAQQRGNFANNGDGTMRTRVTNEGRILPIVEGGGAGGSTAQQQLPSAAQGSLAPERRPARPLTIGDVPFKRAKGPGY